MLAPQIGLGSATRVDHVEIDWPSGAKTDRRDLGANRIHVLEEATRAQ
jgi:hypothetical protein